jgi:hypothetical protein
VKPTDSENGDFQGSVVTMSAKPELSIIPANSFINQSGARSQVRVNHTFTGPNRIRQIASQNQKKVLFRTTRKFISKITGIHGFLTESSTKNLISTEKGQDKNIQQKRTAPKSLINQAKRSNQAIFLQKANTSMRNPEYTENGDHASTSTFAAMGNRTNQQLTSRGTIPSIPGNKTKLLTSGNRPVSLTLGNKSKIPIPTSGNKTMLPISTNQSIVVISTNQTKKSLSGNLTIRPISTNGTSLVSRKQKILSNKNVPFRTLRKLFSKATGIHGAFSQQSSRSKSQPSLKRIPPKRTPPNTFVTPKRSVSHNLGGRQNQYQMNKLDQNVGGKREFGSIRPLPKKKSLAQGSPQFVKPNLVKQTLGGIEYPSMNRKRGR